jgi:DNA-binding HxlR family transcriptional regulator
MESIVENKGVTAVKNILPACPVETTLQLIGNKWKIFVLRELLPGAKRFGELQKSIPNISQKVLTQNLRAMEADGLVVRNVFAEVPPRVEYHLSELGHTLRPVVAVMLEWGAQYKERMATAV